MAENPSTWGPVEKAVDKAIRAANTARADGVIGLSTVRRIADGLRYDGLVMEDFEEYLLPEALAVLAERLNIHVPAQISNPAGFAECSCGYETLMGYAGLLDHILPTVAKEATYGTATDSNSSG